MLFLLIDFFVFINSKKPILQGDTIFTDFHKTFDSINHSLLIYKLSALGYNGNLLAWIKSYLTDRLQIMRVLNSRSSPIHASSGVPQGSLLDPLLFIILINDLNKVFLFCTFLLFVDYVNIFRSTSSPEDALSIQADLGSFCEWCRNNRFT